MNGEEKELFKAQVYEIVRLIPYGRAASYGDIARAAGYPNLSRMVGRIMGGTGDSEDDIPAHRVVNSSGHLSGRHTFATPAEMQELLEAEGVVVINNRIKEWKSVRWNPLDEIRL